MMLFADGFRSFGKLPASSLSMCPAPSPPLLLVPWLHTCPAWNYWCSAHPSETFFPVFHSVEISLIMSSSSLKFSYAIVKLCLILCTNCHCHLKKFDLGIFYYISPSPLWRLLNIENTTLVAFSLSFQTLKSKFTELVTADWSPSPYGEGHRYISDSVHTW